MRTVNKVRLFFGVILLGIFITGCNSSSKKDFREFSGHQLTAWNKALTQVVITDVLTPPVCSRVYAYCNIAAYEALVAGNKGAGSYSKKLNGLKEIPAPAGDLGGYDFSIASIIAFSTVAQKLVFNKDAILDQEALYLEQLESYNLDAELQKRSIQYGRDLGQFIISWAVADGYLQRNSRPAYIVTKAAGRWIPTPPDYMDAVEPNWNTLRPFTLDSASQFRPVAPFPFDTAKGSDFYKQMINVYNVSREQGKNNIEMAKFWDCNPNISITQGHVTYFQQKISPAGHWVHISASICDKEAFNELKTARILSTVAIAMADGFISCWEAKYRYNSIRPETVINRYIDNEWRPLLQTPPFPEYPSGHSVVSGAASTILASFMGDNYAYTDSTELPFGIPARQFNSFTAAANEASVSRLYGGIHCMPALNNGLIAGRKVAANVLQKLQ